MTGEFESQVNMAPSTYPLPKSVPQTAQMKAAVAQYQRAAADMNRMTMMRIVFEGSKVRIGSGMGMFEYTYRFKNAQMIEVRGKAMGTPVSMEISVNPDGTLTYMGQPFVRVQ